ncbi:hypothetical protein VC116063_003286 [Vibrio cholerae O1 str. 116063]|nr:hypothetical protein VC116063_003286 [Vibrio cholerae O1 str. 116063]
MQLLFLSLVLMRCQPLRRALYILRKMRGTQRCTSLGF